MGARTTDEQAREVWRRLDSGQGPLKIALDVTVGESTVRRLRAVKRGFEGGRPTIEIVGVKPWTHAFVGHLKDVWQDFRQDGGEEVTEDALAESTLPSVRRLLTEMWAPNPDWIPALDARIDGLRDYLIGYRPFTCETMGGRIARCWFSEDEGRAIRRVPRTCGTFGDFAIVSPPDFRRMLRSNSRHLNPTSPWPFREVRKRGARRFAVKASRQQAAP